MDKDQVIEKSVDEEKDFLKRGFEMASINVSPFFSRIIIKMISRCDIRLNIRTFCRITNFKTDNLNVLKI